MKTKTRLEWFNLIKDEDLKNNILYYFIKAPIKTSNDNFTNLSEALSNGFIWDETDDGYQYWETLCEEMREHPSLYLIDEKIIVTEVVDITKQELFTLINVCKSNIELSNEEIYEKYISLKNVLPF